MPNNPTDRIDLHNFVRALPDEELRVLAAFATNQSAELPALLHNYSDVDRNWLRLTVDSECANRLTTVEEWVEIARDWYADFTKTKRKPQLVLEEDIDWIKGQRIYRDWTPDGFLNAVWFLSQDRTVDHSAFEAMPYFYRSGYEDAFGGDVEAAEKRTWVHYVRKFTKHVAEHEATVPSPNCVPRCHIKLGSAFAVYDFATAVSRKTGGECWLSLRAAAKWCGLSDLRTIRIAIDWLVANGWLEELEAPRAGVGGQGRYRVVEHEEWMAKFSNGFCVRINASRA
jgi:hypothetical protein